MTGVQTCALPILGLKFVRSKNMAVGLLASNLASTACVGKLSEVAITNKTETLTGPMNSQPGKLQPRSRYWLLCGHASPRRVCHHGK